MKKELSYPASCSSRASEGRRHVLLAAWLVALASAADGALAGPSCRVSPFQGAASPEGAVATMQVSAGGTCSIVNYGVPARQTHPADSGKVLRPPRHGKAEFAAPRIEYTPDAGYVGTDEFEYEALARGATDRPIRLRVRVEVTVIAP